MVDTPNSKKKIPGLKSIFTLAIVAAVAYFGNVEVQSYLGRKAVANTGFTPISLELALVAAKAEDKLILADMSAIWCSSCRRLDAEVFGDSVVQQAIREKYIFSRIEYESDEGEAFMEKYNVTGFPTLLVLDAEGNLVRQLPLTFDPQEFASMI
jgi:thiol:disulfide interchange protein